MKIKEKTYGALVRQYKNNIYSYSLFMLKDEMDADDVTQEVMIKIWNNLGKFRLTAAKTWIMKTTHNQCIDFLRKRQVNNNREYSIDEVLSESYRDDNHENDPFISVHTKMINERLENAIQQLPQNLRSIFVLYEIHGLKYKEISKALGLPLNTVKVYLMRSRKELQKSLKKFELQEVV
jgi:RNA polymerase sigma-70 factor (ECF subfamily)